jgi:hypothetical protein
LEADDDLDLLFVTFDQKQITIEELKATIAEHGFKAQVKEEAVEP